jgi:HlyD family secretion protein
MSRTTEDTKPVATKSDPNGASPDGSVVRVEKSAPPTRKRKFPKIIPILLVLALGAFLLWWFVLRTPPIPDNIISVSGRVESDDSSVAAKTAGRIHEITVREGDTVKAGQVIAVLEDDQVKARETQAQASLQESETRLQRSRQQVAVLQAQLDQSRLGVTQAHLDADGRVRQAEAQVASAEASLAQAEASYEQARYDAEKFTKLVEHGDVPERQAKQAVTTLEAQAAVVRAARKQVDAARGAYTTAKANLENPAIRMSQSSAVEQQIRQALTDIESAQADADRSRAQLEEARANRNDLNIVAPFDATVATRSAEPGEVVAAGSPIVTLVNYNDVYLRGFVPEGDIGRVRVGQTARVYLDSDPKKPVDAVVSRVDPEASFTPENTYFRDDRVKQVVGVKLKITNPGGFAKPGMPADGEILVSGDKWPSNTGRK